jgi:superfamily II DNA/RNA helicase
MSSLFSTFPLLPTIQETLAEKNFLSATEIQTKAIPILLEGRSLVGIDLAIR